MPDNFKILNDTFGEGQSPSKERQFRDFDALSRIEVQKPTVEVPVVPDGKVDIASDHHDSVRQAVSDNNDRMVERAGVQTPTLSPASRNDSRAPHVEESDVSWKKQPLVSLFADLRLLSQPEHHAPQRLRGIFRR